MANKPSTKADLAREYRKKHGSKIATLKLARIMYNENNLSFTNAEDARQVLRYIEGKSGSKQRKCVKDTEFVLEEARPYNPYSLPASDETSFEPFILSGYKKIGIFCDTHAPYHNITALTLAIEFCKKEKVDCVIVNGDHFDFHGLSRYVKDPTKRHFADEINIGCDIFKVLQRELDCPIIYKLGNHCLRLKHFIWQKASELAGLDDFELGTIINKRVSGITIVEDKTIIKANELNIVHGHEFGQTIFSPVSVARGLYMRAKANSICGHHHRTSENSEMTLEGKIITTWSIGALCELHPDYFPINNWNNGFAIVDLDSNGKDFNVRNKRIWKGKIL